jgi:hypothetical protein
MLQGKFWSGKYEHDSLYGHKAGVKSLKLLPSHGMLLTGVMLTPWFGRMVTQSTRAIPPYISSLTYVSARCPRLEKQHQTHAAAVTVLLRSSVSDSS